MPRFTKKVLLQLTPEMYSDLIYRASKNGTSVSAEIRMAVSKTTPPKPVDVDTDIDLIYPDEEE